MYSNKVVFVLNFNYHSFSVAVCIRTTGRGFRMGQQFSESYILFVCFILFSSIYCTSHSAVSLNMYIFMYSTSGFFACASRSGGVDVSFVSIDVPLLFSVVNGFKAC